MNALPEDVVLIVGDFVGDRRVSLVCGQFWRTLGGSRRARMRRGVRRSLRYAIVGDRYVDAVLHRSGTRLRRLDCRFRYTVLTHDLVMGSLRSHCVRLSSLRVALRRGSLVAAVVLAAQCPTLREFRLACCGEVVTAGELAECPPLSVPSVSVEVTRCAVRAVALR